MPETRTNILDSSLPLTARDALGSPDAAASGAEQDHENQSVWTVQQFSEVNGEAWFALHQLSTDGTIQKGYTGHAHEIADLAERMNITPRALPAISEEQYYAKLGGGERDFQLGRHFAADPSRGIDQNLAPQDLQQFVAGMQTQPNSDQVLSQGTGHAHTPHNRISTAQQETRAEQAAPAEYSLGMTV